MKKIGDKNWALIAMGVKETGTYNPDEILDLFIESLYVNEVQEIKDFLRWVHETKRTLGHGNYEKVFKEWKKSL